MLVGSKLVFIKTFYNGDDRALSLSSGDILYLDSNREVFPCNCELIVSK